MDNEMFIKEAIEKALKEKPEYEGVRGNYEVTLNHGVAVYVKEKKLNF
mgnify:CR=1 FL=1